MKKTVIILSVLVLISGSWQTAKGQSISEIDSISTLISQLVKKSIHVPIGDSIVLNPNYALGEKGKFKG